MRRVIGVIAAGALVVGCADVGDPVAERDFDGPGIEIAIAALDLAGVEDALWDIRVANSGGDTVFQTRITASQFGDGVGSASYVGPCDASSNPNIVEVELIGIYGEPQETPGGYGEDEPEDALPAQNPGLMSQEVECVANGDVFVQFDVSILRPANQGFIDLAVNFNNIFCSAKYDCGAGDLLHNDGVRDTTHVFGFACTGGIGAGGDTMLYLDDPKVTCYVDEDENVSFDFPLAGYQDGNQGPVGEVDFGEGTEWAFFEWAIYSGSELLAGLNKRYFNMAFGLGLDESALGAITSCRFQTVGTADNGTILTANAIPAGSVYPYIEWDVELIGCTENNALTYGTVGQVQTQYTSTEDDTDLEFDHGFDLSDPVVTECSDEHLSQSLECQALYPTGGEQVCLDGHCYRWCSSDDHCPDAGTVCNVPMNVCVAE